jgi:hypothetical protein
VIISSGDIVREWAGLVVERVGPHLLAKLEAAHGPQWLDRVNDNLTRSGRRPGSGIGDVRLCLAVFAFDDVAGWAHPMWRSMAGELLGFIESDVPVSDTQADRAIAIALSFAREWPRIGSHEPTADAVDETDRDGYGQSKWFTLSFTRPRRADVTGGSEDPQIAAPALLWRAWHDAIVESLRPHLEEGWSPLEPPGPQHFELQVRWRRGVVDTRWEVYVVRFQLLLTRTRP